MYIWFIQKASLMASMRKALLVLALSVVMLQMASLPAMAKPQQAVAGQQITTTATTATQQGSVTPPANNSGGNDVTINQQSTPPPAKGVGIAVDPVKDQGKDNAYDSKTGNTLIHCSPGVGCSKEDASNQKASTASADAQGNSANNGYYGDGCYSPYPSPCQSSSQQDPILVHCSPGKGCSTKDDTSDQKAPTTGGEVQGCSSNYYNENLGTCESFLPLKDSGFLGVLSGKKPFPTTLGGLVSFVGDAPGDLLTSVGGAFTDGGKGLDDTLSNWGNEIGGPVGDVVKGLGTGLGDTLEVVGGLLEGLGTVADDASGVVGATVDGVGAAAEDLVDTISGWL